MMRSNLSFLVAPFACAAGAMVALAACGSNEGGPTPDGGPPLDGGRDARTDAPADGGTDADAAPNALTITELLPAPWDDNVGVKDPIRVTFSEPVKLGAAPIALVDGKGAAIASTSVLSADGHTISVTPASPFTTPLEVFATFGDIVALDGSRLASPSPWRWTIPRWHRVGGRSSPSGINADAVATADGRISMSYLGNVESFTYRPLLSWFEPRDGEWKRLGDPNLFESSLYPTATVIDPQGAPVLFVPETIHGHYRMRVKRWLGAAWKDVGYPFEMSYPQEQSFSVAIGSNGHMFVARHHTVPAEKDRTVITVTTFNGKQWDALGPHVHELAEGDGYWPIIAVDTSGTPYVSYTAGARWGESARAQVRKWSGSAWVQVGDGLSTPEGPAASAPIVFNDAGELFALARASKSARLLRFDGTTWIPMGEPITLSGRSDVTAGSDGRVFVIWEHGDYMDPLHIAKVTRTEWARIEGPVSPIGSEISLMVEPDGQPLVGFNRGVYRINH